MRTPRRRLIGRPSVFADTVPPPVQRQTPGPGQESVWDYPRPPRVEAVPERIRVVVDGLTIADSTRALRVLETAGAPVYYVPPGDARTDPLEATGHVSVCGFTGEATYHTLVLPSRAIPNAPRSYRPPPPGHDPVLAPPPSTPGRVGAARGRPRGGAGAGGSGPAAGAGTGWALARAPPPESRGWGRR